jgi:hypothetical protein
MALPGRKLRVTIWPSLGGEHDTGECDRGRNPGRGRRRGNPFLYAAGLMNPSALMSDFRTQSAGRILSPTRYN